MKSRERVMAAIAHREPDRIPVDMGGTPSSGISAVAYSRLKAHLGFSGGSTRVYDVVQQLAQPEENILDRLGVDVLDIGRTFNESDRHWAAAPPAGDVEVFYPAWFHPLRRKNGTWEVERNGTVIARMPSGGAFFDQTFFPYIENYPSNFRNLPEAMGMVLWSALVHSPWDHAGEPDFWEQLRKRALALKASNDRALMVVCGCNLFEWGAFLRRMDNFLMDLIAQPAQVEALLDALMGVHLATLARVCEAVGDVADILRFGDDLGMTHGPLMSPATYRELFKPRHSLLNAFVKKNSSMKTLLHSCGSIADLMPDLIEVGYDVINPVQTNAAGMDPVRLKREFGKDITFWGGGCETAGLLDRAAPEQVRAHVLDRLEILAPGGGFIFNTVHNILPEVPPENILAAFDAVREFNGDG